MERCAQNAVQRLLDHSQHFVRDQVLLQSRSDISYDHIFGFSAMCFDWKLFTIDRRVFIHELQLVLHTLWFCSFRYAPFP